MKARRVIAICLAALGGIIIFFATETIGGAMLIVLGVLIETVGIYLENKR